VLGRNRIFVFVTADGSIAGSFVGSRLLGVVSNAVLLPLLAIILLISAVRMWRHGRNCACVHSLPITSILAIDGNDRKDG
jgi:uncharacterized membrane protein YfcA